MVRAYSWRTGAVLLFGAMASPVLAGQPSEVGYKQGALGVSAIMASDYRTAEAQLGRMDGVSANDPLRLINLGHVYMGQGRLYDAEQSYLAAMKAPNVEVMTADGGVTTIKSVASLALRRLRYTAAAR